MKIVTRHANNVKTQRKTYLVGEKPQHQNLPKASVPKRG